MTASRLTQAGLSITNVTANIAGAVGLTTEELASEIGKLIFQTPA